MNTQTTQTSLELKPNTGELMGYTDDHTTLSNYDNSIVEKPFEQINQIIIHPPLRVRLQKVNEKSVALKWDHNPLNSEVNISGYKIYINNIMRGTVKSTDLKALINGIQEEGEYK